MSDLNDNNKNKYNEDELSSFAASVSSDHADLTLLDEDDPYDELMQQWNSINDAVAAKKNRVQEEPLHKRKPSADFAVRRRVAAVFEKSSTPQKEPVQAAVNAEKSTADVFNESMTPAGDAELLAGFEMPAAEKATDAAMPQKPAMNFAVRNRSADRAAAGVQRPAAVQDDREPVVVYRPYEEAEEPAAQDLPENGLTMFSKYAEDLIYGKKEHRKNEKTLRLTSQIISLFFAVLLFLVAVVNLAVPDKEFSENENRRLAQMPSLSVSTIANGSFMADFETSMTDQFVMRDFFVKMRTRFLLAMGKTEVNDIYIAKDGYLIPKPPVPDSEVAKATIEAIDALGDKKPNIRQFCAFIPRASSVLSDKMPNGAVSYDDPALIESIFVDCKAPSVKNILVSDALRQKAQTTQIYYRTDHHWTTAGAYAAFEVIAREMGLQTAGVAYNTYTVSDSFMGTASSSSGMYQIADSVEVCIPAQEMSYMVEMPQEGKKMTSVFAPEYLQQKDKYSVFFGGNPSIVNISTDVNNVDTLLIIKDSYANALVPMLLPYYRNIIMIDPRYYMDSFDSFLQTHKVTDILYLFSIESVTNAEALQRFLVS